MENQDEEKENKKDEDYEEGGHGQANHFDLLMEDLLDVAVGAPLAGAPKGPPPKEDPQGDPEEGAPQAQAPAQPEEDAKDEEGGAGEHPRNFPLYGNAPSARNFRHGPFSPWSRTVTEPCPNKYLNTLTCSNISQCAWLLNIIS